MNTIALDVRASVFKATHYPSFLQQAGAAPGSFISVSEETLLDDFLHDEHLHVFDVAVGDSGTGKSHLIRWMSYEIARRNKRLGSPWWIVDIPRSSANLTEVVRRILHGFDTEVVLRLRAELEKDHEISLDSAKTRVLDEFCFVLEEAYRARQWQMETRSTEDLLIFELLPALLRAREVRRVLGDPASGIVTSLAQHVLGRRESRDDLNTELTWQQGDLDLDPRQVANLGGDAGELAAQLMDSPELRKSAAEFLNLAKPDALRNLLRFRKGDMQRALVEIRRVLHEQGKDLVLLIEDLSVTEGLNAELLEALQVRTRDTGEELCRLRSMVGVTNEDHARMLSNIREGRTLRTVFLNVPVGLPNAEAAGAVGQQQMRDFASRYLNAARHSLNELDQWAEGEIEIGATSTLPTACAECRVRNACHESFGDVEGRGLYPLTDTSLERLYRQATASSSDSTTRSFNPRRLVGSVLSGVLEEAERGLPNGEFPGPTMVSSFGLDSVRSEVRLRMQQALGPRAARLQRALDVYAESPASSKPALAPGILAAFELPVIDDLIGAGPDIPGHPPLPPTPLPPPSTDHYELWLSSGKLADRELNKWRSEVYSAVAARIDWDVEHLAVVADRFRAAQIGIEGQRTEVRGEPILQIKRTPAAAIAIRALVEGLSTLPSADRMLALVQVRRMTDEWTADVKRRLRKRLYEGGTPPAPALAIELLVLGARIRGKTAATASQALAQALELWPEAEPPAAASVPWRDLVRAFRGKHEAVRSLLWKFLACTKGAQAGAIIDPSPILPDLERAMKSVNPRGYPESEERWQTFRAVRQLAVEVERHLTHAIEAEARQCEQWWKEMSSLLGNSPKDAIDAVQAAFAAATPQALLQIRSNSKLLASLQQSDIKTEVEQVTAAVRRVVRTRARLERVVAIGALDHARAVQIVAMLREMSQVLDHSLLKARAVIGASGGDGEGTESTRARDQLAALEASLLAIESVQIPTKTERANV